MKSLSNDIRITQGKSQQQVQDYKNSNTTANKKLQQLIQANNQCQATIKQLQKQSQILTASNKALDQQIQTKKQQLEKAKSELQEQQQKQENQGHQQMQQWISNVQNYSGVPQEVIDNLISMQYQGPADQQQICLSCYQAMQTGIQCKYLPCCHLFHSQCIDNHLKVNKLCPACGESVSQ